MNSCVLGIDGGGSKTVCILMDEAGKVLGRGEAGSSNYQSVGVQTALLSIESAISQAVENSADLQVKAICLGLAGVSRSADLQVVQGIVQQLQLSDVLRISWALQPSRIVICSDSEIALVGGIGEPVGVVVIAGTGSIAFGRNRQGNIKRVGGWGYLLGDEGSAYYIAIQGVRAALKSYDGRSEATHLQTCLPEYLGLESVEDFIEIIYQQRWSAKEIAALAPIVDQSAVSGDLIAQAIIEQAVQELVTATKVVIKTLFNSADAFEVVTVGSVWNSLSKMRERFATSLTTLAPSAKVISPRSEPASGAGLLALRALK